MSNSALHLINNSRSHQRVKVSLYGIMRISEVGITRVSTINISESGILLNVLDKPPPQPNDSIYLQLDGILSDNDNGQKIHKMNVVRTQSNVVGLTFA